MNNRNVGGDLNCTMNYNWTLYYHCDLTSFGNITTDSQSIQQAITKNIVAYLYYISRPQPTAPCIRINTIHVLTVVQQTLVVNVPIHSWRVSWLSRLFQLLSPGGVFRCIQRLVTQVLRSSLWILSEYVHLFIEA